MTQINSEATAQASTFNQIATQTKETLVWAKDSLSSAAVSGYAKGKEGLQYLGVKSVELFKASPQVARDTYSKASVAAQKYYSQRSAYDMALDVGKATVGSFAAYKVISFGPTNLANLVGRALYLPFEYADHLAYQNSFLNPVNITQSIIGLGTVASMGALLYALKGS